MPVDGPQYPVNLNVGGRRCLVVGGGAVAKRKIEGLLRAGALVHVIATHVSAPIRELDVTWEERPYVAGDIEGFRLAITATDSPSVNRSVFEDGERLGIWVNAADEPNSCSFTLPAVIRNGDVMVTVSTGGHSPALSTWLKGSFEPQITPEMAAFLQVLSGIRQELKVAGRSTETFDWQGAFADGVMQLVEDGELEAAEHKLRDLLGLCALRGDS